MPFPHSSAYNNISDTFSKRQKLKDFKKSLQYINMRVNEWKSLDENGDTPSEHRLYSQEDLIHALGGRYRTNKEAPAKLLFGRDIIHKVINDILSDT